MKIIVASDHAGRETRDAILEKLRREGHQAQSAGPSGAEKVDDPDVAAAAARRVAAGEFERGVLVCGTGLGMMIASNQVPGIRAVTVHDDFEARMSRSHNDANIVCSGERSQPREKILELLDLWLREGFEGGRHASRLEKIHRLENEERIGEP